MNYFLCIVADILLAINFSIVKAYQKNEGTSLYKGFLYNTLFGAFSAVVFFSVLGFKVEINTFSFVMAFLLSALLVSYTILGFKVMEMGKISVYTVFLMSGGMIVPYLWGIAFLNESFSILRSLGVIIIVLAMIITNSSESKEDKANHKQIVLCTIIFFLNGGTSVVSKLHQISEKAVSTNAYCMLRGISMAFLCGTCLLILLIKNRNNGKSEKTLSIKKSSVGFIALAVVVGGVSAFLQLNGAKNLPATVVYPLITGGTIIFSAFTARIFYKEKITKKIAVGIILCFIGSCLFL